MAVRRNRVTYIKDTVWLLVLALLSPVWMAAICVVMAVVVTRQVYMWARGNTTALSRG